MNLPDLLKEAIEREARSIDQSALSQASQELTKRYRDQSQRQHIMRKQERFVNSAAQRIAYVLARMPATYEAVFSILNHLKDLIPFSFHSLLDVGAGPATATWAAATVFPNLVQAVLLEQDASLIDLGKNLSFGHSPALIKNAKWKQTNLLKEEAFPNSDLTIVSYSMGEWPQSQWEEILNKLWKSTQKLLLIVEPGTMAGFKVIVTARQYLIEQGAYMAAPCPHLLRCPMAESDWCHFSTRIARSSLHRQIKKGTLGHEDEKFSYIAVSKRPVDTPLARIVRHPQKHSGHINFKLCSKEGLIDKTISRREGERYKEAKDLEWGDPFI